MCNYATNYATICNIPHLREIKGDPIIGKKILISVLNWGLGHATRCIPLIQILDHQGHELVIASDGPPLQLLKKEFPHLKAVDLPSYGITYFKKLPMVLAIALQMPKIVWNIYREKRVIRALHQHERFDMVISDCRFGCFIKTAINIYLTHQVLIRFPAWLKFLEPVGAYLHRLVWRRFDQVWIIDRFGKQNLSGELGHSYRHSKIIHIGILSRFHYQPPQQKNIDYCFLLSGPEPQRSILERIILAYHWPVQKKYYLIRGLPETQEQLSVLSNWTVVNHLSSQALQKVLYSSQKIVCRSGYSTIMDLARLGLSATLVPTPGQPEQEYLATYIKTKFGLPTSIQNNLHLEKIILESHSGIFGPYHEQDDNELLLKALTSVLKMQKK